MGKSHTEESRLSVEGADLREKWQVTQSKWTLTEVVLRVTQIDLKAVTDVLEKERLASKLALDQLRLELAQARGALVELGRGQDMGGASGRQAGMNIPFAAGPPNNPVNPGEFESPGGVTGVQREPLRGID